MFVIADGSELSLAILSCTVLHVGYFIILSRKEHESYMVGLTAKHSEQSEIIDKPLATFSLI